jgi:hypothetical protein
MKVRHVRALFSEVCLARVALVRAISTVLEGFPLCK